MLQSQITAVVFTFNSEAGAGNFINAAYAFGQTAYESSFAAAQIANQLNCLTAF